MSDGYPAPEIWPDDDPNQEPPSKDELARDVLSTEEYAAWRRQRRNRA